MPLPTTTADALQMIDETLRDEHAIWNHEIRLDALAIDESRIRETPYGWWVPLGQNTKWAPDYRGDEAFIVITRDGSSNGLYLTGKPLWWDAPAPQSRFRSLLRRLSNRR